MSLPALGTYCTICFNLPTPQDIRAMAETLGLFHDREFLGRLNTGEAIVKLKDRYQNPFLVRFLRADATRLTAKALKPWVLGDNLENSQRCQTSLRLPVASEDSPTTAGISPKSERRNAVESSPTMKLGRDFPISACNSREISKRRALSRRHRNILRLMLRYCQMLWMKVVCPWRDGAAEESVSGRPWLISMRLF